MFRHLIVLSLALAGVGCTAPVTEESAEDLAADVDDPAGKEDGVIRPVGTFDLSPPDNSAYKELTLFSDRTFHIVYQSRLRCGPGRRCLGAIPVTREIVGTYRYTKSGNSRYIRFTENDELLERFRYRFDADSGSLTLTPVADGVAYDSFSMERDGHGGWCEVNEQCAMQELPLFRCLGAHWECTEQFECVPAACGSAM